jgi:hypothetical protein
MFATAMVTLAPTKRGDSSRDGCHPAADGDGAQVRGGACVARACASLFIAVCVCLARQRPLPPPSPPCHRHHRGVVPNLPRGCRCRGRRPCRLDRAGRCVVHVAMSGMWCCRLTPFCCRRGRLPSVLCRRVLVAPCCCCRASSRRLLLHTPPPQCMLALTTSWSVLLRAPCVRVCTRGGVLRDCLCRWPCACRAAPTVPAGSVRAGALALKCGMIPDWNKWGVRYPLTVLKVRVTSHRPSSALLCFGVLVMPTGRCFQPRYIVTCTCARARRHSRACPPSPHAVVVIGVVLSSPVRLSLTSSTRFPCSLSCS